MDCSSFVLCPLLLPNLKGIFGFFSFLFVAAVNSTDEANKAGGARH
jgi:hypothetical protein